jgi:hypothetical protein
VLMELLETGFRLFLAQVLRARQPSNPNRLLNDCTLHAAVVPDSQVQDQPGADQQLLTSWVIILVSLTITSKLGLHALRVQGLKAATTSGQAGVGLPPEAVEMAHQWPERCPQFSSVVQKQGYRLLDTLGALMADAFPDLTTLELVDCNIPAVQLQPLLSTAPVKCLKLTGGTQLGSTDGSQSLHALLRLLSSTSIEHLEVVNSLGGCQPPSLPFGGLPAELSNLKRVVFQGCGPLHRLVPLLRLMPSLTHLEVRDESGLTSKLWRQLLPGMPHLKTLVLPTSSIDNIFPAAVLEARSLDHLQVIAASQDTHLGLGTATYTGEGWTPREGGQVQPETSMVVICMVVNNNICWLDYPTWKQSNHYYTCISLGHCYSPCLPVCCNYMCVCTPHTVLHLVHITHASYTVPVR